MKSAIGMCTILLILYLSKFIPFPVFCMFYVLNGVLSEEVYQLYVFIIAVSVIVVYCVIEYIVNADGQTDIKLVSYRICWQNLFYILHVVYISKKFYVIGLLFLSQKCHHCEVLVAL